MLRRSNLEEVVLDTSGRTANAFLTTAASVQSGEITESGSTELRNHLAESATSSTSAAIRVRARPRRYSSTVGHGALPPGSPKLDLTT